MGQEMCTPATNTPAVLGFTSAAPPSAAVWHLSKGLVCIYSAWDAGGGFGLSHSIRTAVDPWLGLGFRG